MVIKNFAELKKELSELAGVVNSFKSEAVQLRIVDLVFRGVEIPEEQEGDATQERKTAAHRGTGRKTKISKPKGTSAMEAKKAGRGGRRAGAATILTQLIGEEFFKTKRTINAIIDHADKKKAHKFKANELSGPLARFVRDHRLDRDQNQDGQYEYFAK